MSTRKAKRQGTIEPPRGLLKTTREKVVVDTIINNKPRKKIMIITTYESQNSITIYIGNRDIYCIDAQILKNSYSGIYETGLLTKARWDMECSLDEPFKKGVDSIIIIKLLLTYIKDKYPTVKELLFTDMSTKECDNGSSVNLAGMKVFTDGKTWYETHLDVTMDDIHKNQYNIMKEYAEKKKKELSFNTFMSFTNTSINKLPIPEEILEEKYNTSSTWQEFFSFIRNSIGVEKYCIWLSTNSWFDNFIFAVLKFQTLGIQFIFEPKQYNISYTIMGNIGGRNKTLKAKRR